jgi:hypothetical protein
MTTGWLADAYLSLRHHVAPDSHIHTGIIHACSTTQHDSCSVAKLLESNALCALVPMRCQSMLPAITVDVSQKLILLLHTAAAHRKHCWGLS